MKIGIIGGSGLKGSRNFCIMEEKIVTTKYGNPSSKLICGVWHNKEVVLLYRHGEKHTISPSKTNYRANIISLKEEGVTHIIATSAAGSLREEIKPGHFVVPTQFIDRTTKREATFYDENQVCHISMGDPFCPKLTNIISKTIDKTGEICHKNKVLVVIEGPRFSTRAESNLYREWGGDVINMTTVPEVILAREVEICYALIISSTDYDAFLKDRFVTWDEIVKSMEKNSIKLLEILDELIKHLNECDCSCRHSLKNALV